MKYTNQEKKNHKNYFIALLVQIFFIGLFGHSVNKQYLIIGALSMAGIMLNTYWITYIAYSHGWELKRISLN